MSETTSAERIRNTKLDELLGERGPADNRAARISDLKAALLEIERLTALYNALAKRITALEP